MGKLHISPSADGLRVSVGILLYTLKWHEIDEAVSRYVPPPWGPVVAMALRTLECHFLPTGTPHPDDVHTPAGVVRHPVHRTGPLAAPAGGA